MGQGWGRGGGRGTPSLPGAGFAAERANSDDFQLCLRQRKSWGQGRMCPPPAQPDLGAARSYPTDERTEGWQGVGGCLFRSPPQGWIRDPADPPHGAGSRRCPRCFADGSALGGGLEDLNFAAGLAAKDGAGGCPADVPPAPQRPAPADKEPFRRLRRPARRRQG